MNSLHLSTSGLLNIGMDGPTVNTSFVNQLKSEMEENHQSFIDIGTCPLHITNNNFKAILNVLKPILGLVQVITDLQFFFKRSAARRKDYKVVENIAEITTHYISKHAACASIAPLSNAKANGEFERIFFEGDTEIKWL